MFGVTILLLIIAVDIAVGLLLNHDNQLKLLGKAVSIAKEISDKIRREWMIEKFPKAFLSSLWSEPNAWEKFRLKIKEKVLAALAGNSNGSVKFIISFTGSSVTAGHDSHIDQSFPKLIEQIMRPLFLAMGNITLVVRLVNFLNCYSYCSFVKRIFN